MQHWATGEHKRSKLTKTYGDSPAKCFLRKTVRVQTSLSQLCRMKRQTQTSHTYSHAQGLCLTLPHTPWHPISNFHQFSNIWNILKSMCADIPKPKKIWRALQWSVSSPTLREGNNIQPAKLGHLGPTSPQFLGLCKYQRLSRWNGRCPLTFHGKSQRKRKLSNQAGHILRAATCSNSMFFDISNFTKAILHSLSKHHKNFK